MSKMNQFLFIFQHLDIKAAQPSPNQWQHWFARMVARECSLPTDENQQIMKKQLLIIGGGFAGFWSAISAIRQSREIGKADEVEITLVNADNYFTIRPRLYEVSLDGLQIQLAKYLQPLGIRQVTGTAKIINPEKNEVAVLTAGGIRSLHYDYLILATGGALKDINLPGIQYTHNIDTFDNAQKLEEHLAKLSKHNFRGEGSATFVVAGAGLTGLETATSIEDKARAIQARHGGKRTHFRVVLIDRDEKLGSCYPPEAQQYISKACAAKNIEVITGAEIKAIAPTRIVLNNGNTIPTRTVIWTIGMMASSLTQFFAGEKDQLNRLKVDNYLKLPGYNNVIVSGDVANVSVDNGRTAVMACQYAQVMGRWSGHNAINDLFSLPLKEYVHNNYFTVLDLGEGHALFTKGWDRIIQQSGTAARDFKKRINTLHIYPMDGVEDTVKASYPEIPDF